MNEDKNNIVNKLLAVITIIAILLGGGVGWGLLQARVDGQERVIAEIRSDVEILKSDSIRRDDFHRIIFELREDNRRMQEDIKKILQEVSSLKSTTPN